MSESPLSSREPLVKRQCTAKSRRTGERCRRPAMVGSNVCYHHGGKTPRGLAHPSTKTGRYSKYLPARLAERYESALNDPDLISLRDEIALTDADIGRLLALVDDDIPDGLDPKETLAWRRAQRQNRAEIHQLIENRRKLVETERRRLIDLQQMMTVEQAMLLLSAVESVVNAHVDRPTMARISADLARIMAK